MNLEELARLMLSAATIHTSAGIKMGISRNINQQEFEAALAEMKMAEERMIKALSSFRDSILEEYSK